MRNTLLALTGLSCLAPVAQALTITPVGAFTLNSGTTGASELSGITYAGGNQFYTVADNGAGLFPLAVSINPTTGAVVSAALSGKVQLSGSDLEGVAFDPTTGTLIVADESGPTIRRHNPVTGTQTGSVTVPSIYANVRPNLSLESLSRQAGTGHLWTSNEESLTVDGPVSTTSAGTVVRLQKFDTSLAPVGQWAYRSDPIRADGMFTTAERSGVSDLLALPDGRLIVLERELGGSVIPDFRNRLYLVNFTGATDVSALTALDAASFTTVGKTLLWEGNFAADNYEGVALGPTLDNGDHTLLLVSDNNNEALLNQSLYALRLSGAIPEPTSAALIGLIGCGLLTRRGRRASRAN